MEAESFSPLTGTLHGTAPLLPRPSRKHLRLATAAAIVVLVLSLFGTAPAQTRHDPVSSTRSHTDGSVAPDAQPGQYATLLGYLGRAEVAADAEVVRNNWRYFWSALAQSLAAIATLIFTVTLVSSQLRAPYGMGAAKAVLTIGNTVRFFLLLAGMAVSLLGIHWRALHNPFPAAAVVLVSIGVLVWHSTGMPRSLSMKLTVARLGKELRTRAWQKDGTVDMLRQLETIAYGALARSDFDTLHESVEELARVVAHAARQKRAAPSVASEQFEEEHQEALSFIRKLLLEAARSPKATSIVAHAFVDGVQRFDPEGLPWLASDIIDTFDFALRTCAWPSQEESRVSVFEVMGLLLEAHARLPEGQSEIIRGLIDRCTVFLPESPDSPGSGHAAYALLLACLRGATAAGGQRDAVDVCMQKAFDLVARQCGWFLLQRFLGLAVERVSLALSQVWNGLDELRVLNGLESMNLQATTDRLPLVNTYRELLESATCGGKLSIASGCLHVLNVLSTQPRSDLDTLASNLALVAKEENSASLMSEAALGTPVQAELLLLVRNIEQYCNQGTPQLQAVIRNLLVLAKACKPRVQQDRSSLVPGLWQAAKALQGRVINHEASSDTDKQEATYIALTIGWLAHLYHGQFDRPKYEEMKDALRKLARSYDHFNPFKATERAKDDFPPYAQQLERYYLGRI